MHGNQYIKEVTGDYVVYPGHPLVVAYEIMSVFTSPEDALKPCRTGGLNCPEAVADNRISGGGGEVYAACNLLHLAQQGASAEELIAWADERWVSGGAGGHTNAIEPGLKQAEKLKREFTAKLETWIN